jgi:hypothetical protein
MIKSFGKTQVKRLGRSTYSGNTYERIILKD